MGYKILVTGGAGFIGSFLVDTLIEQNHDVRVLDNLTPQVHHGKIPPYLNKKAEFIKGDILDYNLLKKAIEDVEIVFHQAAKVGIGQSMYQVKDYVAENSLGTANLLDILINTNNKVKKLVVASSFSLYGEGSYECEDCGLVNPSLRGEKQMKNNDWELKCPSCRKAVKPVATNEEKTQNPTSLYAITKKTQEDMVLTIGKAYGIPAVALRYFLVYGPRQSINNPYTGVVTIFISRLKNKNRPIIYEDGLQTRDFVSVHDIVAANILAMRSSAADYEALNVGTGRQTEIKCITEVLSKLTHSNIKPEITNKFRKGDIRHCFADISKIKHKLGFEPRVKLSEGMAEVVDWSNTQDAIDNFKQAEQELRDRKLF